MAYKHITLEYYRANIVSNWGGLIGFDSDDSARLDHFIRKIGRQDTRVEERGSETLMRSRSRDNLRFYQTTETTQTYQASCWNFVLLGGVIDHQNINLLELITNLFQPTQRGFLFQPNTLHPYLTRFSINELSHFLKRCGIENNTVDYDETILNSDTSQERIDFWHALLKRFIEIFGFEFGVNTRGHGQIYIGCRSSSWIGWEHWGIGVRHPSIAQGEHIIWVQTVPHSDVYAGARQLWEEDLPLYAIPVVSIPRNTFDRWDALSPRRFWNWF